MVVELKRVSDVDEQGVPQHSPFEKRSFIHSTAAPSVDGERDVPISRMHPLSPSGVNVMYGGRVGPTPIPSIHPSSTILLHSLSGVRSGALSAAGMLQSGLGEVHLISNQNTDNRSTHDTFS